MTNLPTLQLELCYVITGKHLILDCNGLQSRMNSEQLDVLMREAANAAGATIIKSDFHQFGQYQGITGVVMLAESHITVHTWPERNYAAFDIFMCGNCDPKIAANKIQAADLLSSCCVRMLNRGQQIGQRLEQEQLQRVLDNV